MFSKSCKYGIKATLYIAKRSIHNERVSLKEIAKSIDSPVAFTAKILQQLVKEGVINSLKGPTGGFEVDDYKLNNISVGDVVRALDGEDVYVGCGLGLEKCNESKPCPLHNDFVKLRINIKTMLEQTNLREFALELESGLTFLKR